MQFLVGRARGAQRELLDAVAGEARVRVAVDEPGDGGEPVPVELLDLDAERRETPHLADLDDARPRAEHVRALEHVDEAELGAAQRGSGTRGGRDLGEVADEEARGRLSPGRRHSSAPGADGRSSRRSCATSIASS